MVKYKRIRVLIKLSILVKVSFVVANRAGASIYSFFTSHYAILNIFSIDEDEECIYKYV